MGQLDERAWAIAEWGLTPDGTYAHRYGHAEPVRTRDGTPAVLKLGPTVALEWFSGRGGVRVLAVDRDRGAALIERLGAPLVDDEAATAVAAEVMGPLWRRGSGFTHVSEYVESLTGRPAAVFAELCDSMGEEVVLHGDLHHENILRAGDGWLAIDPEGVIGEREYEAGAFLRNPLTVLHDTRTLARRADQLAEALDLDGDRIRAWAWAQAHLAAAWSIENGEDPGHFLAVAERLAPLSGR
jgi:streptomycin 6-kinase